MPADPYDLRIAVVETNDIAAEQDKYGGQDQGEQKADGPGAARVGLGHIVAAFSQRLPHKGRGRNGKRLSCHKGQGLDIHADLVGRIRHSSQGRHSLCVNDDPRAHQKLLHHSRKTDVQDISQDSPVRLKALPEFQLQESVPLKDHRDRNGKGHELPDHRRNGGAGNAQGREAQVSVDQKPVKANVDAVGDHVVDHTRF